MDIFREIITMTSVQKSVFVAAIIGAIGIAAYFLTSKTELQTAEHTADSNLTSSKEVVIEENTMKQLKSLGYTN